jgi:hypothetical protein
LVLFLVFSPSIPQSGIPILISQKSIDFLSFANAFFSKRDFFASFRSSAQVRRVSFFHYSDNKSQSQTNQQTGKLRLPGATEILAIWVYNI